MGRVTGFLVAGWVYIWMCVSDCLDRSFWLFGGMGVFHDGGMGGWLCGGFVWWLCVCHHCVARDAFYLGLFWAWRRPPRRLEVLAILEIWALRSLKTCTCTF